MNAIQHFAFNCRDRLTQERFYVEHFGFRRARVFNAGKDNEFVMTRLGSVCLEFFTTSHGGEADRGGEQSIGFKHLAFEVSDLDAIVAKFNAAGVETGEISDASLHVPGMRICFFKDPEGNIIELMEGWHDDPLAPAP